MDSRILEIVFCLMDYAQDSGDDMEDMSEYSSSLRNLGFTEQEISTAYNWILGHSAASAENLYTKIPERSGSTRILTESERARIAPDAHGFLLRLFNLGVLTSEQFESVLDRLTASSQRIASLEQVKLVVSAVMFNEFGRTERDLLSDISSDRSSSIN
ncbi:MAG: DUF494 family protein [Candidatus Zixiibacteriota bacterium]